MRRLILACLVWCLSVLPASADVAFIQGESTETTGATSVLVTFATTTTGTMFWVGVSWVHTADDDITITVTDTAENTYTAGTRQVNPGIGGAQGFYAFQDSSGSNQITATMSDNNGAPVIMAIFAAEVSGVDTMDPLDDEDGAQADGVSSLDVGTLTTTENTGIAFTQIQTGGTRTFSQPTNYTSVEDPQRNRAWAGYRETGAAGSYGATWTWTGGTSSTVGIHMAFKASDPGEVSEGSVGGLLLRGVQ